MVSSQAQLCRSNLELMQTVVQAAREVKKTCQKTFADMRWNCSSIDIPADVGKYRPDLERGMPLFFCCLYFISETSVDALNVLLRTLSYFFHTSDGLSTASVVYLHVGAGMNFLQGKYDSRGPARWWLPLPQNSPTISGKKNTSSFR